ncbi:MAG: type II toxin-antitoxin system RelE/ParE family toxin [Chloroflexi bacterium]|nr:type II toxin-antitoxin system RelE/ParE family toxin [Chloroflexota bacterium]
MAYQYEFANSAEGDLDKLIKHNPALAVQLITEHIPRIVRDPKAAGEKKTGELSHLRAYGFSFRRVACRIVYDVDDERKCVTLIAIGIHDVAYDRARKR